MAVRIVCAACARPIEGRYYTNAWKDVVCATCQAERPHCYSCDRVISRGTTNGGHKTPDGRAVCAMCARSAVRSDSECAALLREVRADLARIGLDISHPEIQPKLVSRSELDKKGGQYGYLAGRLLGLTEKRKWQDGRRTIGFIYVLNSLPREHAGGIIAHEVGHAWLFLHGFPDLPNVVEEGVCEVWCARWLALRSGPLSKTLLARMAANTDPVYGDGYRKIRGLLKTRTLPGALEKIRRTGGAGL